MSQATYTIGSGKTGTQYRSDDNDGKQALSTSHKGSSAPSYKIAGMIWCDDAADPTWVYKQYDGTDWNEIFRVNISTGLVTFPNVMTVNGATTYAADGGSTDTYAVTLSPVPTAYAAGMFIFFKANTSNTGACTLNANSLGAKTIKKKKAGGLADLDDNDIIASDIHLVIYDGTVFQLMSTPNLDYFVKNQTAITTLEDTDCFLLSDHSDSEKNKKIAKSDLVAALGSGLPVGYRGSAPPVWASVATITVAFIRDRNSADDGDIKKTTSTTVNIANIGLNGVAQSSNLTGTITCSGTAVIGTGTAFLTDFIVGDVIWSSTESTGRRITAIADNTHLTVESSWTITSGTNFKRGGEAPSTPYCLYSITDGSTPGMILPTRDVDAGQTLVDLPSGYNKSCQQEFAWIQNSSNNLIDFKYNRALKLLEFNISMTNYLGGSPEVGATNIVNNLNTSGSWPAASCTAFVPRFCRKIVAAISITAAGVYAFKATGESHNGDVQVGDNGTTAPHMHERPLSLNSSQSLDWRRISSGTGSLYLDVKGFYCGLAA